MSKIEWNVIVFDKLNSDRTKVRPQHVASIPVTVNDGIVTSAGAIYNDATKTQFAGSTFHMLAESKEDVFNFSKKDMYYESGIWDLNNVIVHPVGITVRLGKAMLGVKKT